jgi:WxcM-like protein
MRLDACRMIDLPKIVDPRGSLTFVEGGRHVPFEIRRVYYLYDVPGGAARAGHGHRTLEQLIVAVSGSFDVELDDGRSRIKYHLNRAASGLYMPGMIWRQIDNFSTGSVCLVMASDHFDEADYYRDYDAFVLAARTAP